MKRILIAPLDWGLGHATRCIPIIKYFLEKNIEVVIGADGRPFQLLKKEFPLLEFVVMPGYNISYPENDTMVLKMAVQIPKILSGIKREHELLKKIIKEKKIDAVISDNRFGLWSRQTPCVFITHQLMVKSPLAEKLIYKLNQKYISRYSECWVPDFTGENNLSADLSHKFPLHGNVKFIGLLSRFYNSVQVKSEATSDKLLIVLSGPEPQRTIFEKIIIDQLTSSAVPENVLIVQGITEKNERRKIADNIEIVSHLTSEELKKEILAAKIVVSRPGYSTVMDLAMLGKKAIFVTTPGQTEQEYLSNYFSNKKIAYSVSQKEFNFQTALKESEKYSGFTEKYSGEEFKKVLDEFILSLT